MVIFPHLMYLATSKLLQLNKIFNLNKKMTQKNNKEMIYSFTNKFVERKECLKH